MIYLFKPAIDAYTLLQCIKRPGKERENAQGAENERDVSE
jgi:hypothetical protein